LLGSIAGVSPNPHAKSYLPYGAAKAGVLGYTKHLAKELGGFGITVNAVSPGTTATERVMQIRSENDLQQLAAANPLNHRIEPSDSAAAVLFLASPQAKGITGVNLNVNAGSVML
jgi:3-oxoacyl-[acyl-carrier protein] reductase